MAIRNCKAKVETTVPPRKKHANDNKITKYTHVCTMHAKNRKEIIHATRYLQSNLGVDA